MRLTDLEARQWRNRALSAERELAALRRRLGPLRGRSFLAIYASGSSGGTVTVETAFVEGSGGDGAVRDANWLRSVEAAVHANIRRASDP